MFPILNVSRFHAPPTCRSIKISGALPAPDAETLALMLAPAHPPAEVMENGPLAVSVVSGEMIPVKLSVIYKHNAFA